jgi:hypothetical protein
MSVDYSFLPGRDREPTLEEETRLIGEAKRIVDDAVRYGSPPTYLTADFNRWRSTLAADLVEASKSIERHVLQDYVLAPRSSFEQAQEQALAASRPVPSQRLSPRASPRLSPVLPVMASAFPAQSQLVQPTRASVPQFSVRTNLPGTVQQPSQQQTMQPPPQFTAFKVPPLSNAPFTFKK